MKKCPVCQDVNLEIRYRNDIEIDYCTECRGIWLDRGELEKIIERSTAEMAAATREAAEGKEPQPPHKQKRNLITELFDF